MSGQVQTERGMLLIDYKFKTTEDAKANGYSYAFHSTMLDRDLYSKCLDDRGLYHTFAIISAE